MLEAEEAMETARVAVEGVERNRADGADSRSANTGVGHLISETQSSYDSVTTAFAAEVELDWKQAAKATAEEASIVHDSQESRQQDKIPTLQHVLQSNPAFGAEDGDGPLEEGVTKRNSLEEILSAKYTTQQQKVAAAKERRRAAASDAVDGVV
eukprot:SAG31_NODE_1953_length_6829_cov_6.548886_6_plen_154_part_00